MLNRKTSLTYPDNSSEAWSYYNAGNGALHQFTNRAGNVATFTYDNFNRVTLSHWNDSLTPDVTTGYDAASRVTSITNSNSAIARAYFSDNLLKTETNTYADGIARGVSYTYDADGRRATMGYPSTDYSVSYTYTGRHQVNTILVGGTTVTNYDYDRDGNIYGRALDNSTSSSYAFDAMDRVSNISHALAGTTRTFSYGYDSVGIATG